MVITVTLNPAVDKTIYIDNFKPGNVNRILDTKYNIAGKGINVSKDLRNFGVHSVCTGFIGGTWQRFFLEKLRANNINTKFVHIESSIRLNVKIIDNVLKNHTDINEAGPTISEESLNEFIYKFTQMCKKGDIVVLAGSVSPSVRIDIYADLAAICREKGAISILDTYGEFLKGAIAGQPDILKITEDEFVDLMGIKHGTLNDYIEACVRLQKNKIKDIFILMNNKSILYVNLQGAYYADEIVSGEKVAIGVGDCMTAAIVFGLANKYSSEDMLKVIMAFKNILSLPDSSNPAKLKSLNKLMKKVNVKSIRK